MQGNKTSGKNNTYVLVILAVITMAATAGVTLLLTQDPRPITTWVVLGFLCWIELILFGYAIRNSLGVPHKGEAAQAIVSTALVVYGVIGLTTVLCWIYFSDSHRLNTILAFLLAETAVAVLLLTVFLRNERNLTAQEDAIADENVRPVNEFLSDLIIIQSKIPILQQSMPEQLYEISSFKKTLDSVMMTLQHSGVNKKDERVVSLLYEAIGQLLRTAEQIKTPLSHTENLLVTLNQQLNEVNSLVLRLVS